MRVLVTAGAAGIGRAIAEAFARQGGQVHICDVELREVAGVKATRADVAQETDVDELFRAVRETLGGLDVLVNNAGIAGPTGPVEDLSLADWERTLAVNLTGTFLCTRRAVPWFKQQGGGVIINIASVAGRLGYPLRTPYASSKWGVIGLTKSLAIELAPHNIRVNAILPGIVRGERMARVMAAKAQALGRSEAEIEQGYLERISLRRMVTAEDVAAMAVFLASAGGRNITGQAISVCGNVEALR